MSKERLSETERAWLDRRVAEAEERTGAQIVLSVSERSDVYAELPWKAFALGSAVAGCSVVLLDLLRAAWSSPAMVLVAVTATLLAGTAAALLCVTVPGFARLFLDKDRAGVEARQYAESLFLSRELFATRGRTGILLFVSLFERTVVALPDSGLEKRLGPDALQAIISAMTHALAEGQVASAFGAGLTGLEQALTGAATDDVSENELPNRIVEEDGT